MQICNKVSAWCSLDSEIKVDCKITICCSAEERRSHRDVSHSLEKTSKFESSQKTPHPNLKLNIDHWTPHLGDEAAERDEAAEQTSSAPIRCHFLVWLIEMSPRIRSAQWLERMEGGGQRAGEGDGNQRKKHSKTPDDIIQGQSQVKKSSKVQRSISSKVQNCLKDEQYG